MKKFLIISFMLSVMTLSACQKTADKKTQNVNTKPVPQTITQQEVARIALLEAKQLLDNAQYEKLNTSSAKEIYQQAQKLYDEGAFKKAQIKAVGVRHKLDDLRK